MELSAAPTATPLMEEPQSAMTPRQAERPQSQSRAVPSREPDTTFLPRSTMAVSRIPGKRKKKKDPKMEWVVKELQEQRRWICINDSIASQTCTGYVLHAGPVQVLEKQK